MTVSGHLTHVTSLRAEEGMGCSTVGEVTDNLWLEPLPSVIAKAVLGLWSTEGSSLSLTVLREPNIFRLSFLTLLLSLSSDRPLECPGAQMS